MYNKQEAETGGRNKDDEHRDNALETRTRRGKKKERGNKRKRNRTKEASMDRHEERTCKDNEGTKKSGKSNGTELNGSEGGNALPKQRKQEEGD